MQRRNHAASARWVLGIVSVLLLLLPQVAAAQAGEHLCTVVAEMLNLRSGPGTNYTPPLAKLQRGAQLALLARNQEASWVAVQVQASGLELAGWVSSAPQNINCAGFNVTTLPLGQPPPPPGGLFQARSGVRPVPTPGANAGDLLGLVYAGGTFAYSPDDSGTTLTFQDEFALELMVFDPRVGLQNGAGIDSVEYEVYDPDGELVYQDIIREPAYCAPISNRGCGTIILAPNGRWPEGQLMQNGEYFVDITAYPDDEELQRGNWSLDFEVRLGGSSGNPEPSELVASIVEYFRSDALVFQVEAYDPTVGSFDGAGIDNVSLYLYDPDGGLLYDETEEAVPYCLFSNGQGSFICNAWPPSAGTWPNGQTIRSGDYILYAVVTAQDGRQVEIDETVSILVND